MKRILLGMFLVGAILMAGPTYEKANTGPTPEETVWVNPFINIAEAEGCVIEDYAGQHDEEGCEYGVTLKNGCGRTTKCSFNIVYNCNNGKTEKKNRKGSIKNNKLGTFSAPASIACCRAGFKYNYEWTCD